MSEKETTIDDLAGMVKGGFDEVKADLSGVKSELKNVKSEMSKKFDLVEDGQDQIKLKLDNVAYRFEIRELERRVDL